MEISGQQIIPAARQVVWDALNNPEVLRQCLPGGESVDLVAPGEFKVTVKTVIGPLRARFQGSLRMTDVLAPQSCVMFFEGQGGAVGFGKGSADVTLSELSPDSTALDYKARAQVGGKLAQVGSRLIDSVAKKMTDDFFKAFQQQLAPVELPTPAHSTPVAPDPSQASLVALPPSTPAQTEVVGRDSPKFLPPQVPAWWLAPAAVLGALLAIAGSRFMH